MIKGTKVVLREKRLDDAANDYFWKMDAELANLDATFPLEMSFSEYLLGYAEELRFANIRGHRYAIETLHGRHIGNCSYYNLDEEKEQAELGILIGERAFWEKGYGTDAVITLLNYGFEELHLKRVYLHTLEWNTRAKKCFQKCGFAPRGNINRGGQNFVIMDIEKANYQNPTPYPVHHHQNNQSE